MKGGRGHLKYFKSINRSPNVSLLTFSAYGSSNHQCENVSAIKTFISFSRHRLDFETCKFFLGRKYQICYKTTYKNGMESLGH